MGPWLRSRRRTNFRAWVTKAEYEELEWGGARMRRWWGGNLECERREKSGAVRPDPQSIIYHRTCSGYCKDYGHGHTVDR